MFGAVELHAQPDGSRKAGKCFLQVIPNRTTETIQQVFSERIARGSLVFSDGGPCYKWLGKSAAWKHKVVVHADGEFSRKEEDGLVVSSNAAEGLFSRCKRFLCMSKDGSIWQLFVLCFTIVWDTPEKEKVAKWSSAPASIFEGFNEIYAVYGPKKPYKTRVKRQSCQIDPCLPPFKRFLRSHLVTVRSKEHLGDYLGEYLFRTTFTVAEGKHWRSVAFLETLWMLRRMFPIGGGRGALLAVDDEFAEAYEELTKAHCSPKKKRAGGRYGPRPKRTKPLEVLALEWPYVESAAGGWAEPCDAPGCRREVHCCCSECLVRLCNLHAFSPCTEHNSIIAQHAEDTPCPPSPPPSPVLQILDIQGEVPVPVKEPLRRQCRARGPSRHVLQPRPSMVSAAAETITEEMRGFTPSIINEGRCLARVWNSGKGGQCWAARPPNASFCRQHGQCQAHGVVTGPIPMKKLMEFRRANAGN